MGTRVCRDMLIIGKMLECCRDKDTSWFNPWVRCLRRLMLCISGSPLLEVPPKQWGQVGLMHFPAQLPELPWHLPQNLAPISSLLCPQPGLSQPRVAVSHIEADCRTSPLQTISLPTSAHSNCKQKTGLRRILSNDSHLLTSFINFLWKRLSFTFN